MKNSLLTFLVLIFLVPATGKVMAQLNVPVASPPASVYSRVGLNDITVDYSRPSMKGRKIFGEGSAFLQPYGQMWRTGANLGTVLKLTTDATIAGTPVKAGEYLIFTVPSASSWKFMLYSDVSLGGNTAGYDKSKEVLEATITPVSLPSSVETFTVSIANISADNTSAELHIMWENTLISVPVEVNFHDAVMKEIADKTQVSPTNYVQAANYYFTTGQDLEQAYEWAAKGTQKGEFWNMYLQAQILAKMGKKDDAVKAAQTAIDWAKASGNDFGYIKLNEDLIATMK